MAEEMEQIMSSTEKEKKTQTNRTALLRSATIVVVVLALIIGLTYAWFSRKMAMAINMQITRGIRKIMVIMRRYRRMLNRFTGL